MYVSGCHYPMAIEWIPACAGRDGAMVEQRGEGQRPNCPYPSDRWCVRLHRLFDDRIEPYHPKTLIWAAKSYPWSHIVERRESPGPLIYQEIIKKMNKLSSKGTIFIKTK